MTENNFPGGRENLDTFRVVGYNSVYEPLRAAGYFLPLYRMG